MWKLSQRANFCSKLLRASFLNRSDVNPQITVKSYFARGKKTNDGDDEDFIISKLFQPSSVKQGPGSLDAIELTGEIKKPQIQEILNEFHTSATICELCEENGLNEHIKREAITSFRKYCFDKHKLSPELYIKLFDVINNVANVDELFPYFLKYSHDIFPHLRCMNDLKKASDLSDPSTWYPLTRNKQRKIIFHAGPTNSGKTYHAIQRFLNSESGIYCGPLKLLAMEIYQKSNAHGTVCDLVTGEEKRFGNPDGSPASHVAITVEMALVEVAYEVAVIDEIQMMKDQGRGWAWTRAFMGINADEVHICGEPGTKDLIEQLCLATGEILEYHYYDRLTPLTVEDKALETLENLQDGDCIVCFNKNDIYEVTREIEKLGREVSLIYGSLPPNTKLAQAAKFNDPNNPCKVMVATDAIGMGLNLCIRRIIFYSVVKMQTNEKGEKEVQSLSVSTALQIAGRAGRFGTKWDHGYVTTFKPTDIVTLKYLLSQDPEPITQAGVHPTATQIQLYAFHLPDSTMSNLIDIFTSLSTLNDDLYFMCMIDDFKFLAESIQHINLKLKPRYIFCCAPVNRNQPFVCAMFTKFANLVSKNERITFEFVAQHCGLPVSMPKSLADLVQLENIFDVMDIYLWLSYRFPDMFPHTEDIREAQAQLDELIQKGLANITILNKDAEKNLEVKELTKRHRVVREPSKTNGTDENVVAPISDRLKNESLSNYSVKQLTKRHRVAREPSKTNETDENVVAPISDRLKNESLSNYLVRKGILSKGMLSEIRSEIVDCKHIPNTLKTTDKTKKKKNRKPKKK